MKLQEMNETIREYMEQTGDTLSSNSAQVFLRLLALCDYWKNIGMQDAQLGRFLPPAPEANSPFDEIVDLLKEYYTDGFNSIKRGPINEDYYCISA